MGKDELHALATEVNKMLIPQRTGSFIPVFMCLCHMLFAVMQTVVPHVVLIILCLCEPVCVCVS